MKINTLYGGEAHVTLNAEECDIISSGCKDGATSDNPSISGDLSRAFSALAHLLPLVAQTTETK